MSAPEVHTDPVATGGTLARQARRVREGLAPVPTPCLSVCRMDEARGWCMGCLRTRDELRAWRELDDADKRVIWARIEERLPIAADPS